MTQNISANNVENAAPRAKGVRLRDRVVQEILGEIHSNQLAPGSPLPSEVKMAETLNIGRGTVREAVQGLAALGILEVGNGHRPKVARISGDVFALLTDYAVKTSQVSVQQTLDVRQVIEARTVQLAALHRTENELRVIQEAAENMRLNLGDHDAMTRHDIDFHEAIALASRNPLLALQVQSFRYVIERTGPIGWRSRPEKAAVEQQVAVHSEIAEAIADRDPNRAMALMSAHFTDTISFLARAGFT